MTLVFLPLRVPSEYEPENLKQIRNTEMRSQRLKHEDLFQPERLDSFVKRYVLSLLTKTTHLYWMKLLPVMVIDPMATSTS